MSHVQIRPFSEIHFLSGLTHAYISCELILVYRRETSSWPWLHYQCRYPLSYYTLFCQIWPFINFYLAILNYTAEYKATYKLLREMKGPLRPDLYPIQNSRTMLFCQFYDPPKDFPQFSITHNHLWTDFYVRYLDKYSMKIKKSWHLCPPPQCLSFANTRHERCQHNFSDVSNFPLVWLQLNMSVSCL